MGARVATLVAAIALGVPAAAPAAPSFTTTDGTLRMSDGVRLAWTLRLPVGELPAGGYPAVVLAHGGTGSRSDEGSVLTAEGFAEDGFAALTYDRRGHGSSTGLVDLAGPRDVADLRAIHTWLAARPEIRGDRIGAWGGSVGGGVVLNAVAVGVPFAAVEAFETWSDLERAFWPQGIARSRYAAGFLGLSPVTSGYAAAAGRSEGLARLRPHLAARSSLQGLSSVRVPVYLLQGRNDWLFDVDQAVQAYRRLAGPKKLYVGAFGHAPASFPGPDFDYVYAEWHAWFDRFLKGVDNGVDRAPPVALGRADGSAQVGYAGEPPTTVTAVPLRGTGTRRVSTPLARPLETFGAGTVRVTVKRLRRYPRLVATVVRVGTGGFPLVVTEGAVRPHVGVNTIRLASYAIPLPAGSRLEVRLGAGSGFSGAYDSFPQGTISLGGVTLALPTLVTPVSSGPA